MDSALDIKRPPSLYSFWITHGTLEMVVLHSLQYGKPIWLVMPYYKSPKLMMYAKTYSTL